jgi:valyl-tRNA synthetase
VAHSAAGLTQLRGISVFLRPEFFVSMQLATKYNPAEVESKWYEAWLAAGVFQARVNPAKEPYCIVIPPPNVTGVLHMGHMLNNTIQDVLIRKARMEGKEACWVPGTDHASIATEARVVAMLREKGIKKSDLTREEFLTYAWEWKEKYGGIILEQLKKLGASCDWDRTHFTMDPDYYKAVIRVFVDLYRKGFIYRGLRMINWDCEARTALSNEEVLYKEEGEKSVLYHVKYQLAGREEFLTIATQRPETIMGDVAIAVNPNDSRYQHLIGTKAIVPMINREVPIIADTYVDVAFGTGCLKVTPAHDVNDYEIGQRHGLPVIDTINDDGTLNERCEIAKFVGMDRFKVRKEVVRDLHALGLLVKEEEFVTRIGRSERTNSVVEPKLSLQWFVKMKEISVRAKDAVETDEVRLYPAKFKNTYRHWMENVRDWCISRQLWWGHRIPAYYYGTGPENFVVAESVEEACALATTKCGRTITATDLRQDADVLDTWASSWLWPIEVFQGLSNSSYNYQTGKVDPKPGSDLAYFYPTQVLVTAPEILFFWVARMLIAGYEYRNEKPFQDVYLTGIVRDKQGRKMSKSLGNSPDPLDLMEKYGADGVRTGMLFSSPAGNDLLFDEKLCEQGRNFANKIWNAFRLIQGLSVAEEKPTAANAVAIRWFESRFNESVVELNDLFAKYRISEALKLVYNLIWDDFCAWYLEIVKPAFGSPIDQQTHAFTLAYFEKLMSLLHPFMPFLSEELWQALRTRPAGSFLAKSSWPLAGMVDSSINAEAQISFEIVTQVRNLRSAKGLSPKEPLPLVVNQKENLVSSFWPVIQKLGNLSEVSFSEKPVQNAASFRVQSTEFFLPLGDRMDQEQELVQLQKELVYQEGFLQSVLKKLSNERFVAGAPPAVIAVERKKQADAEAKITSLRESVARLSS